MKVLKFGGSSMATPQSIKKVAEIIKKTDDCVVVVSAPGKRFEGDKKVTDILLDCYSAYIKFGRCDVKFKEVTKRFEELSSALKINCLGPLLSDVKNEINAGKSIGYASSRGEFLIAKLLAEYIGVEFVDAVGLVKFDCEGKIDYEASRKKIDKKLRGLGTCIVPGFYGVLPNGIIRTFDRGGSDITGSLIASSLQAEVYENWTDVDGVYFANPNFVSKNKLISALSYDEMKLLSFMGACVLHYDSVSHAIKAGITVLIKNTFNPCSVGSVVSRKNASETVCGVSIKENLCFWEYEDSSFFETYFSAKTFVMRLPSSQRKLVVTEEISEEEKEDITSASGRVQVKNISIITAVGENIKKSVCQVTKRILNCVENLEFLVYDGGIGVYIGLGADEAVMAYQKICDSLDFD